MSIDPAALAEAVFAHAPIPYAIYGADGRFVRASDAFVRMFGATPPPEYDLFTDELIDELGLRGFVRSAFAGEVVHAPIVWYDPRRLRMGGLADAKAAAIACTGIPLFGPAGVEHVLIAYLDVTAEHEARTRLSELERERELREASGIELERLQSLFAQAPATFAYLRGPEHVVEAVNLKLLAGRPIVGRPIREGVPELAPSGLFDLLDRVRATGEPATDPAVRAENEALGERWFHVTAQATRGPDGQVEGILVLAFDVTEQVQARRREEALTASLKRSEERYRSLVEATAQIIWITTPSGRFTSAQSWAEFTGQSASAIEQGGWIDSVHPEDRERTREGWERALRDPGPYEMQHRVRRADGRYRQMQVRAVPVRATDGSVREWVGVHWDVTARLRAEANARFLADASRVAAESLDSASILQRLTELAASGFATFAFVETVDQDGRPRRVAAAHRTPERSGEVRESPRIPHDAATLEAIERGERARLLRELREPNALAPHCAIVVPLRARGTHFGLMTLARSEPDDDFDDADLAIAEDLARRAAVALENARLYREAQDAIHLRDEFLSIASHELKTPLTALSLKLQAWSRGKVAATADDALGLQRQVKRLGALVDSLLDVSRISAGRLELDLEPLDLAAIVREVAARYELEAERAGCALRVDADRPVVGLWDRLRIEQVIANLLSNAIKYGPGKPIDVRVEADEAVEALEHRARITIRDEGIGIDPAALARIFERFERAVSRRQYGGLGLGLYVARQIVDAMGGTIHARSEPGHGATFVVELPVRV